MLKLSNEQKSQLYSVVRDNWNVESHSDRWGSAIRVAIRSRRQLKSMGWEIILISIISKVIWELIKYWLEQRDKDSEFEPSAVPPEGFLNEDIPEGVVFTSPYKLF